MYYFLWLRSFQSWIPLIEACSVLLQAEKHNAGYTFVYYKYYAHFKINIHYFNIFKYP